MSEADQSGAGRREVAYRLFATEYEDADRSYSESDEERAPNYVITPSGARINRLFVVGVLTEVEQVSDDVLRARVADPTGAFVLYAGQYQPDEMAFLEAAEPPAFVAVTGKARTFQPDDSERVYTSVRPESINEVDPQTRDRWLVQAAEHTLDRVGHAADALALDERGDELRAALEAQGVDEGLAGGIPIALDHYETTPAYLAALRDVAVDVARVVAGTRDEVSPLGVRPDGPGDAGLDELRAVSPVTDESGETQAVSSGETVETEETGSTSDDVTLGDDGSEPVSGDDGVEAGEPESVDRSGTPTTTASATDADEPTADASSGEETDDSLGDFDPGEYELEAETREQIEEEFGTDFQTGAEVEEPGEADIQTETDVEAPDETGAIGADESSETGDSEGIGAGESGTGEPEPAAGPGEPESTDESTAVESETATDEPEPEDLQSAVVELMHELDDGSGADRDAIVDRMETRYGTDEDDVADAIQGALMDGQCYEPDETTLKPI
jgi:RPA family protein